MRVRDRKRERVARIVRLREAFGSSTAIILRTCTFSARPAPTMDFLTRFGAYSATSNPACAGASSTIPRACPSFKAERGSALTKVSSTAASCGELRRDHRGEPRMQRGQAIGEAFFGVGFDRTAGDISETVAFAVHDPPAGAAEAGVEPNDANCALGHGPE